MAGISLGGGQAFFDESLFVKIGRNSFGLMAATSLSRRYCSLTALFLWGKRTAALIFEPPPVK